MFDKALDTLFQFLASEQEILAASHDVLFLRARSCAQLSLFAQKKLLCQQTFKPEFDILQKRGFDTVTESSGKFDLCLSLGSKQRDENFIQFAAGIDALRDGGVFLCCLPKELGAGRFEKELKRAGGEPLLFVKNHCRVFGLRRSSALDESGLTNWRSLSTPRPVAGTGMLSRPGIFGWDKVDQGSELLAAQLPPLKGKVADLGSGYGFLAQQISKSPENLDELHLFEAEKVALDASQASFKDSALYSKIQFHWHDVTSGIGKKNFDVIVSNPPFHSGKTVNINLGEKFIEAASAGLKREGEFYLVANSSLPYERTLQKHFRSFTQLVSERGFKVIRAVV